MNKFLTLAIKLWELGYSPVPVRADGSKSPAISWKPYQDRQIPRDLVIELFSKPSIHGIGIICGNGSLGLVMFEFEGRAVAKGLHLQFFNELKAIDPDLATLIQGWTEWTPSGGLHFYWRCTDDPAGSGPLAKDADGKPLIETKGQGGFTVIAPSGGPTHDSGKDWKKKVGGPHTCPTLSPEQQQIVLDLATSYSHVTPDDTTPAETLNTDFTSTPRNSTIDDIIAEFNRTRPWPEIIGSVFEFVTGPDHNGIYRLRYIGQSGPTGATINATGNDTLIIWSSTAAGHGWLTETPGGKKPSYDKFSAWVKIRHNGDRLAALRELGWQDTETLDAEADKITASIDASRTWPTITPLEVEPEPPTFPLDVLPDWIQTHVDHVAQQVQVPVDLPATTAIGSLVAPLTGRCKVQVQEGWTEPINLFQVVSMRSGSGKSPAVNQTVRWLHDLELALEAASAQQVREAEEELGIAQGLLQRARKAAAGGSQEGGADVRPYREAYEQKKQDLADARPPRLVAQDATPEGLINVLSHHPGIAIISPEAELFDMVTRGKSTERAQLDIYLKAFSGETYIKDRKGSNEHGPEAIRIPHANLSVCCTVQPAVLDRLCNDELLANRGFAQRFMYAYPRDLVGHRDIDAQFAVNDQAAAARRTYETNCTQLAKTWIDTATFTCHFTPAGVDLVKQFRKNLEPQLRKAGRLENLAEWVSKLQSSVVRLAAVLHLAHGNNPDTPISTDTVKAAIEVGKYWLKNAIILLAYRADPLRQQTHHILNWITNRHPDAKADISTAELTKDKDKLGHGDARSRPLNLHGARDFGPALRNLEDHGYLVFNRPDWFDKLGSGAELTFRLNPHVPRDTRDREEH